MAADIDRRHERQWEMAKGLERIADGLTAVLKYTPRQRVERSQRKGPTNETSDASCSIDVCCLSRERAINASPGIANTQTSSHRGAAAVAPGESDADATGGRR